MFNGAIGYITRVGGSRWIYYQGRGELCRELGGGTPSKGRGDSKNFFFLQWTICFVEHLQSIEGRWLISTGQGTTSYWEITEHLSTSLSKPTEVWWCFNPIFHTQILCLLFHLYKSQLCNIKLNAIWDHASKVVNKVEQGQSSTAQLGQDHSDDQFINI